MNGLVAAFIRSDRPGDAGIVRGTLGGVVGSLAERPADGMDRRQVEHVEAEVGDVWQAVDDVAKRPVTPGIGRCRPREQLVPGREAGELRLHDELQGRLLHGLVGAIGVAHHQPVQGLVQGAGVRIARGSSGTQTLCPPGKGPGIRRVAARRGTRDGAVHEGRPDPQVDPDVLVRVDPLAEIPAPGCPGIGPGGDGERVASQLPHPEGGTPAVVAQLLHRQLAPLRLACGSMAEPDAHDVVAVGERVSLDDDRVAEDALRGEAACVHLRGDRLDDRAPAAVGGHVRRTDGRGVRDGMGHALLAGDETSLECPMGRAPNRGGVRSAASHDPRLRSPGVSNAPPAAGDAAPRGTGTGSRARAVTVPCRCAPTPVAAARSRPDRTRSSTRAGAPAGRTALPGPGRSPRAT